MTVAEQDLQFLCLKSQFETSRFSAVQRLSTEIQTMRYTTPVDTSQVGSVSMPRAFVDETARSILSENKTSSAIQPIITTGDGNCLFNAASRSICGNERMASELRLRTSLELINNQEFYSSHPAATELNIMSQSGKLWPKESIYDVALLPLTGNCNKWTTVINKKVRKRSPPSHTYDDSPGVTFSGTKKRGHRQLGDFFPPTPRHPTLFHDKAPSTANHLEQQLSEQSDIKRSDAKESKRQQASKHPFISFSPPIIAKTETINKSAEKQPKGSLLGNFVRNKRRKPSRAKTSPKANQAIHGSCHQSSLKQSTLYWSLSNNANSDLENLNSKYRRSDAATSLGTKTEKPLTPFPTRKRLSSSVDDYENLPSKKHHSYLVKNDHYNTKHSGPPNSGQNNTKHIPSSKETKTSDIATTKPTEEAPGQHRFLKKQFYFQSSLFHILQLIYLSME